MKNKTLTVEDKIALRSVLDIILGDDDLRRGFRPSVSMRELNRIHGRLENEIAKGVDDNFCQPTP